MSCYKITFKNIQTEEEGNLQKIRKNYNLYINNTSHKGTHGEDIEKWISYCEMEENKNMLELNRSEGGIDGIQTMKINK